MNQAYNANTDHYNPAIAQMHAMLSQQPPDPRLNLFLTKGNELLCCTDQRCSRYIQDRITSLGRKPLDKELLEFMNSILKNSEINFESLVYDSFGNYIIQKIL